MIYPTGSGLGSELSLQGITSSNIAAVASVRICLWFPSWFYGIILGNTERFCFQPVSLIPTLINY